MLRRRALAETDPREAHELALRHADARLHSARALAAEIASWPSPLVMWRMSWEGPVPLEFARNLGSKSPTGPTELRSVPYHFSPPAHGGWLDKISLQTVTTTTTAPTGAAPPKADDELSSWPHVNGPADRRTIV
jgi:hypothetical protein